ncbi:hypothetical protein [Geobacter sp. AOG1]|nr:hypothetical protein [Geobacter sp. AOG1]
MVEVLFCRNAKNGWRFAKVKISGYLTRSAVPENWSPMKKGAPIR